MRRQVLSTIGALILCGWLAACTDASLFSFQSSGPNVGPAPSPTPVVFLFGGYNGAPLNTVYRAKLNDLSTWTNVGNLPVPLYGFSTIVFNGKIWLIGGYDGSGYRSEIYNSTDGSTWNWVGNFPTTAFGAKLVTFGGKLFHVMGNLAGADSTNVYYSSDGINWTLCTFLPPTARKSAAVAVLGSTLYVMGGESGPTYGFVHKTTDTNCASAWSADTSLTNNRGRIDGVALNGKLLLVGGYNFTGPVTYDDALIGTVSGTISWASSGSFLAPARFGASLLSYGGRAYLFAGYNYVSYGTSIFSTTDGTTWTNVGTLPNSGYYNGGAVIGP